MTALIVALVVLSLACGVGGVFLLAGLGWALIATASGLAGAAFVLLRGVSA